MKPHLRLRRGIWCCSRMVGMVGLPPLGHGYTPMGAYREWLALSASQVPAAA